MKCFWYVISKKLIRVKCIDVPRHTSFTWWSNYLSEASKQLGHKLERHKSRCNTSFCKSTILIMQPKPMNLPPVTPQERHKSPLNTSLCKPAIFVMQPNPMNLPPVAPPCTRPCICPLVVAASRRKEIGDRWKTNGSRRYATSEMW